MALFQSENELFESKKELFESKKELLDAKMWYNFEFFTLRKLYTLVDGTVHPTVGGSSVVSIFAIGIAFTSSSLAARSLVSGNSVVSPWFWSSGAAVSGFSVTGSVCNVNCFCHNLLRFVQSDGLHEDLPVDG